MLLEAGLGEQDCSPGWPSSMGRLLFKVKSPTKTAPCPPQYQISVRRKCAKTPAKMDAVQGGSTAHTKLAVCSLPAEDLPIFVLRVWTFLQSTNAVRGVLKPALRSGAGWAPGGCSHLPKCRQKGPVLGHQGLQKSSLMEEAAEQGDTSLRSCFDYFPLLKAALRWIFTAQDRLLFCQP